MYLKDKLPTDQPVKFTADATGLVAWLETQDPAKGYDFKSYCNCAAGQFLQAVGLDPGNPMNHYIPFRAEVAFLFEAVLPYQNIFETKPWTMGAALERARRHVRAFECYQQFCQTN